MKDKPYIKYFDVGPYPVWFGFTTNPGNFKQELNRLKIVNEVDFVRDNKDATTHYFEHKGKLVIIITIKIDKKRDFHQICGLLVHECVHAWQGILDYIGEKMKPGDEIEAYHIQNMSQALIYNICEKYKIEKLNDRKNKSSSR